MKDRDPLRGVIFPLNHSEGKDPSGVLLSDDQKWHDVEFEVALDSGCTDNAADEIDTPGYELEESEGSRRKQQFTIGDGTEIPNKGQKVLRLEACGEGPPKIFNSVFQITKVTRPLLSVGKLRDHDLDVLL